MKLRSYNEELKIATAQFLDVFNNIVIDRRNSSKTVQKTIAVPCVYGDRSRILKSLENKGKTMKVPKIAIVKTGISRGATRIADTQNGLNYQVDGSFDIQKFRPQPMDIEFEMSIVAKYTEDMDQIVSNFIPMFQPDVYVVWKHPKQPTQNLKSQIIWDGQISYEYPTDISEGDPARVFGSTTFRYKTWVFPGMGADADSGPLIHKINYNPDLLTLADGNYMLDRWYDVPNSETFTAYLERITAGLVIADQSRDNWDWLPIGVSDANINVQILYDDIYEIGATDDLSKMYQILDSHISEKHLYLSDPANDDKFIIKNDGLYYDIIVKYKTSEIITLGPGDAAEILSDGTTWFSGTTYINNTIIGE